MWCWKVFGVGGRWCGESFRGRDEGRKNGGRSEGKNEERSEGRSEGRNLSRQGASQLSREGRKSSDSQITFVGSNTTPTKRQKGKNADPDTFLSLLGDTLEL